MDNYNGGLDIVKMRNSLPEGLDVAIIKALSEKLIGTENNPVARRISRKDFARLLQELGFFGSISYSTAERKFRMAVSLLRLEGHEICSTGGNQSGYWLATTG